MKKKNVIIMLVSFVFLILIVAIYFSWFFAYSCEDLICYKAHQEKCVHTKFINDDQGMTWRYRIKGKEKGECEIEVTALQVKKGTVENIKLEGKKMKCYLPLKDQSLPESDIARCHGELKEGLQDLIIENLHKYIIENLGKIKEAI